MKTYRDWLDDWHVPRGPWVELELFNIKELKDEVQDVSGSGRVIPLAARKQQRKNYG